MHCEHFTQIGNGIPTSLLDVGSRMILILLRKKAEAWLHGLKAVESVFGPRDSCLELGPVTLSQTTAPFQECKAFCDSTSGLLTA